MSVSLRRHAGRCPFSKGGNIDKLMLLIAGILEITWAVSIKMSEGFKRPLPSFITAWDTF